ncbi:hypothetical protein quinque_005213 [Culex quinquefasciatus]
MPPAGRVLLIVIVAIHGGYGLEVANRTEVLGKVEGRLQTYESYWYNDVYYWWPWFSDLATVIAIKLKIAIGLAAIYAFGDGYYWTKSKSKTSEYSTLPEYSTEIGGGGFWDKFRWSEPSSFLCGWGHGRRRRRRDLSKRRFEEDDFAEYLFDSLKQYDEDCRRRVVCEMDFEFRGNLKVHKAIVMYNDQVLGWKEDNKPPERKEHCKKLYGRCRLVKKSDRNGKPAKPDSRKNELKRQSDDFWKEIWPR